MALGCGSPDPLPPFSIQLALDTSETHGCASTECSDYGMACGALVSLRIADAETGEPLSDHCEEVPKAATLCGLNALSIQIEPIPAEMVRIEVAMWDPNSLESGTCPKLEFDLNGAPVPTADGGPAFAGAAYFAADEEDLAVVGLACPEPAQLDSACRESQTHVSTQVDDLEAGLIVESTTAFNLEVAVGEPVLETVDPQNSITKAVLPPSQTHELSLSEELPPEWSADVSAQFNERACVVVLDKSEPEATRAITCSAVIREAKDIVAPSLLVPKATLTQILGALGLAAFPSQGLVIGRVVDHLGAPVAGVSITIPSGTVRYITEDRMGFTGEPGVTASHGYFVSTDAPYDTQWRAQHVDGRSEDGEYRAGLIDDALSAVEIRLQPPN